jgi:hypothetical protein
MPDIPETVSESLTNAARENIRRVQTGSTSAEGHSLRDLIEADKYLSGKDQTAAELPTRGIRFSRMIPHGGGG